MDPLPLRLDASRGRTKSSDWVSGICSVSEIPCTSDCIRDKHEPFTQPLKIAGFCPLVSTCMQVTIAHAYCLSLQALLGLKGAANLTLKEDFQ